MALNTSSWTVFASCGEYVKVVGENGFMVVNEVHLAQRTATPATLVFGLVVVLGAIAVALVLRRWTDKLMRRAAVMAGGVFLFELFTAPMWINRHLGRFAYVYCDLSWVLTLGWTALFLGLVIGVDRWLGHWSERYRFAVYLAILLPLVVLAEIIVVNLGIRQYAPEVWQAVSGVTLFGVPIEVAYYVPVFGSLVIAFYKYWTFVMDDVLLVPVKRRKWFRAAIIAFVGVFLFELLVEPLAENRGFPEWSYVYRDISILMTGTWVLLIAAGAVVVDKLMLGQPMPLRFAAAVFVIGALALPIESWLIVQGHRVYSESAMMDFSGFTTPITGVAVEVAFAIPCYLALIIGFVRYWEIVLDNNL